MLFVTAWTAWRRIDWRFEELRSIEGSVFPRNHGPVGLANRSVDGKSRKPRMDGLCRCSAGRWKQSEAMIEAWLLISGEGIGVSAKRQASTLLIGANYAAQARAEYDRGVMTMNLCHRLLL
jgi:hypothetical protein